MSAVHDICELEEILSCINIRMRLRSCDHRGDFIPVASKINILRQLCISDNLHNEARHPPASTYSVLWMKSKGRRKVKSDHKWLFDMHSDVKLKPLPMSSGSAWNKCGRGSDVAPTERCAFSVQVYNCLTIAVVAGSHISFTFLPCSHGYIISDLQQDAGIWPESIWLYSCISLSITCTVK